MQKYIFSMICIVSLAQGMEEGAQRKETCEWNAQDYANGNKMQEMGAITFFSESGIDLTNKKVLDVGCGTGNITALFAQTAKRVHGIDASKNMIEYAQQQYGSDKVSFEHVFAEDFTTQKRYHTALSFFCLHWIANKEEAIQKISRALKLNAEFFGTHQSTSDPEPLHFTVLKEMIPGLPTVLSFLKSLNLVQALDYTIISDEEFQELLAKNGFEMVSYEQKSFDIVMTKEDFENAVRPVLMSRPIMQKIPETLREWFFNYYINENLKRMTPSTELDNTYIIPAALWGTKVFHARKIREIQ